MVGPISGPFVLSGVGSTGLSGINSAGSSFSNSGFSQQIFEDTLSNLALENNGKISIFTANNPQIPKPSLLSIMQTESLASVSNKQTSYSNSVAINSLTSSFYRDLIFTASALLAKLQQLVELEANLFTIANELQTIVPLQNSVITNYNAGVSSDATNTTDIHNAATTFNTAYNLYQQQIQQHNNHQISDAEFAQDTTTFNTAQSTYNTAVGNYNSYSNTRSTAINNYNETIDPYNEFVNQINEQLIQINELRQSFGLPPVPLGPTISSGAAPTLPQASSSPPAPVTVPDIITPNAVPTLPPYQFDFTDFVNTIFIAIFKIATVSNQNLLVGLQLIQDTRQFIDFFLPTKLLTIGIPPSFKSQTVPTNASTTGTNSNTGLAAVSAALDPAISRRLFNQGAQNALYRAISSVFKPGTIDATLLASANVLALASFVNGQQLIQDLRDSLTGKDLDSSVLSNALALGIVGSIQDVSSKNILGQALTNLLGPDEINNPKAQTVVSGLSSTLNLSSIGSILSLLSSTLQLPGLGAQILGLAGLSPSDLFNLTNQGNGFNTFAFNPLTQNFFAEQLSIQLAQSLRIPNGSILQQNIQNALLQAAQNTSPLDDANTFFTNLGTALGNNAITGQQASDVLAATQDAFFAPAFTSRVDFRNDLQQSLITQGFSSSDALEISSSILGISPQATADQNIPINNVNSQLLTSNLAYNLSLIGITNFSEIADKVINALTANTKEVAEATFQADLIHQLKVQGLTQQQASRVAAGTVIPTEAFNVPSQTDLHAQIVASATNIYSSYQTAEQAQTHARDLADLLVGPANANAKEISDEAHPLSLVNTLERDLRIVRNLDDQTYFNTAIDVFRDNLRPSVDLYAFNQKLLDPGQRILYVNDLIYAQSAPTGTVKMGGAGTIPALQVAV